MHLSMLHRNGWRLLWNTLIILEFIMPRPFVSEEEGSKHAKILFEHLDFTTFSWEFGTTIWPTAKQVRFTDRELSHTSILMAWLQGLVPLSKIRSVTQMNEKTEKEYNK
jgi:hypothetical protein